MRNKLPPGQIKSTVVCALSSLRYPLDHSTIIVHSSDGQCTITLYPSKSDRGRRLWHHDGNIMLSSTTRDATSRDHHLWILDFIVPLATSQCLMLFRCHIDAWVTRDTIVRRAFFVFCFFSYIRKETEKTKTRFESKVFGFTAFVALFRLRRDLRSFAPSSSDDI